MELEVRDLSFRYARGLEVISGLSHVFGVGVTTAVTGPSGRGKSTLLYLLGLMLMPTSGAVLIDGRDMSHDDDTSRSAVRGEHISVVFQDALLDPARTTIQNVLEGGVYASGPRRHERAARLLAQFGVGDRQHHRPGEISGGQAQRVALCRALLKAPSIILADEPTGNLDRESAAVVWQALHEAAHLDGATVVVASHDSGVIASCDELVEL